MYFAIALTLLVGACYTLSAVMSKGIPCWVGFSLSFFALLTTWLIFSAHLGMGVVLADACYQADDYLNNGSGATTNNNNNGGNGGGSTSIYSSICVEGEAVDSVVSNARSQLIDVGNNINQNLATTGYSGAERVDVAAIQRGDYSTTRETVTK